MQAEQGYESSTIQGKILGYSDNNDFEMSLPLQGVRIVAIEQYGAGPFGTLHLASLGAEIIKVETPNVGDVSRTVGPFFVGEEDSTASLFYQGLNHNKKSIAIDLKSAIGKEILASLVKTSDGLVSNLRGDVVDRLGLGYETLGAFNPNVVCAHLTAYGRDGERANWPGYDYIMQAQAGYFSLTGEPESAPARFGLSVVDLQAGITLAMALLAGILSARASGKGGDVDVSLFDVALHNLNYVGMWALNAKHNQGRVPRSAHFSMTPCQLFKTQDSWIYLMCNKEKFWLNLCNLIERQDLASNEKFGSFSARLEHRDELTQILDQALSERTTSEWLKLFEAQVPSAPLLSVEQALNQPFVRENGRIVSYETQAGTQIHVIRPPVHSNEGFSAVAPPRLGEHTDSLLAELEYEPETIADMRRRGIVQ